EKYFSTEHQSVEVLVEESGSRNACSGFDLIQTSSLKIVGSFLPKQGIEDNVGAEFEE
ncbi:hypothetical protein PIB30_093673, partial [Stylosanthes scabra]|nr:hypothetical protein [Stylosanthes scabra]